MNFYHSKTKLRNRYACTSYYSQQFSFGNRTHNIWLLCFSDNNYYCTVVSFHVAHLRFKYLSHILLVGVGPTKICIDWREYIYQTSIHSVIIAYKVTQPVIQDCINVPYRSNVQHLLSFYVLYYVASHSNSTCKQSNHWNWPLWGWHPVN